MSELGPIHIDPTSYAMTHVPFRAAFAARTLEVAQADRLAQLVERLEFTLYDEGRPYERLASEVSPRVAYAAPLLQALGTQSILAMKQTVETLFGHRLIPKTMVMAHDLREQKFLNVHSDWNAKGTNPDYRFVMIFEKGARTELSGGSLLTFRKSDDGKRFVPHASHPVAHNASYVLEFGPESFHAVEPVRRGNRLSLLFSFWKENKPEYLFPCSVFDLPGAA